MCGKKIRKKKKNVWVLRRALELYVDKYRENMCVCEKGKGNILSTSESYRATWYTVIRTYIQRKCVCERERESERYPEGVFGLKSNRRSASSQRNIEYRYMQRTFFPLVLFHFSRDYVLSPSIRC